MPFPSPGELPDLGIEPRSPALQADSLPTELNGYRVVVNVLVVHSCDRAGAALAAQNPLQA